MKAITKHRYLPIIAFCLAFTLIICLIATMSQVLLASNSSVAQAASGSQTVTFTAVSGTGGTGTEGYDKLIDGSTSTKWCTSESEKYIIIKASVPIIINNYTLTTANDTADYSGRNPVSWNIYGNNDNGSTWNNIVSETENTTLGAESKKAYTFNISNNTTYYQYYKFEITAISSGDIMQLSELSFGYTGKPPFVSFSAVDGIGTGDQGYEKLVDGNATGSSNKWCVGWSGNSTLYAVIKASERIKVSSYTLYTANDNANSNANGRNPKSWVLSGSNDYNESSKTGTWTAIHAVTDDETMQDVNATPYIFEIPNNQQYYQYYMLTITAGKGGDMLQLGEMTFDYEVRPNATIFTAIDGTGTGDQGFAKLFDDSTSSKWCVGFTNGETESVYAVVNAHSPIIVTGYILTTGGDTATYSGRNPKNWVLYGSNDYTEATGTGTWNAIHTVTDDTTMGATDETPYTFTVGGNKVAYQYYKLEITAIRNEDTTSSFNNNLQLSEMDFIYVADSAATFSALDGTPNTSNNSSETYTMVVDGLKSSGTGNYTKWYVPSQTAYVVIEASKHIILQGYAFTTGNDNTDGGAGRNPSDWILYGCNDYDESSKSGTWVAIDTKDTTLADVDFHQYNFTITNNNTYYKYYKLAISKTTGTKGMQLCELEFAYTDCDHTITTHTEQTVTTHKQVCDECQDVLSEENHSWNSSGVCTVCGYVCTHSGGTATCTEQATCEYCGIKYGSALGHDYSSEWTIDLAATCTESGSKSHHCSRCDSKSDVTEISALGHSYGNVTYTWAADNSTCTATHTCSNDNSHIETETVNTTSSVKQNQSCTTDELTTYTATFSNSAFAVQTKADVVTKVKTGHNYGDVTYTWGDNNSTCTATHTCSNDNSHVETETVNTTSSVTQRQSCTTDELTTYTATFSNSAFTVQTKADVVTKVKTGHNYGEVTYTWLDDNSQCTATHTCSNDSNHVETETVKTTSSVKQNQSCTTDELTTYKATFTNAAFTVQTKENVKTADALGHDEINHDAQAATCTEKGWEAYVTCSRCAYTTYKEISALGHDEVNHDAQAATCTEIGWEAYVTCSRCDYTTYKEISALGHDEINHDAQAAACTEKGWDAYVTCSRCDYTTYKEISALGHDEVNHDAQAATCTEKGWYAYVTCSRCSYTTYSEIPALGHDEINHDAQAATCTEIGWNSYVTCSRCDYTTYNEISALGHDETNHDAQAVTCTEIGWEAYVTCSRCDYTTYKEISALGHDEINHDAQAATCTEVGWEAYVTCTRCSYTTYSEIPATGHQGTISYDIKTNTHMGYYTCCNMVAVAEEEHDWSNANGVCAVCGYKCISHDFDDNGKCRTCNIQAEAKVDGTFYLKFAEAVNNLATAKTLTLLSDVTSGAITIGKHKTIECSLDDLPESNELLVFDLNGKTLSDSSDDDKVTLYNVKIIDSVGTGVVQACLSIGYDATIDNCTVLAGGTYKNVGNGKNAVNAYHSQLYISGGKFEYIMFRQSTDIGIKITGGEFDHINIHNDSTKSKVYSEITGGQFTLLDLSMFPSIDIKGGTTVEKFQIRNVKQDNLKNIDLYDVTIDKFVWSNSDIDYASLLASEYIYRAKDDGRHIALTDMTADTSVTVVKCNHDWADGVCTICGYECTHNWQNNADGLGGTCLTCGKTHKHYGGTATCTTLAKCEICSVEYGSLDMNNHTGIPSTEWKYDGTSHWHEYSCCNSHTDEAKHSGGQATCTEKATCTECKLKYGETAPENHTYGTLISEVPATCTDFGVIAHYKCACGKLFNEDHVEVTDLTINARGHDEESHEAKAPTCTVIGWEAYVTCSRCNYTTYKEIPALGHDEILHDGQDATCTEAGNKAYVTCSRCDYTTYEKIEALGHSGGTATCTGKATCSVCGVEYGEPLGHDIESHPALAPTCTEAGYEAYETCSRCDYSTYKELSALGHKGGEATCTQKAVCDFCGAEYGELDKDNHIGEIEWIKTETTHSSRYDCCHAEADPEAKHEWANGACSVCQYECIHSYWTNSTCNNCGLECTSHVGGVATCVKLAECEICGAEYGDFDPNNHEGTLVWVKSDVTHMRRYNCCGHVVVEKETHEWTSDGICAECGYVCGHSSWTDDVCDTCGYVCPHDSWTNGVCDLCHHVCEHVGGVATCNRRAICDVCGSSYGNTDSHNHGDFRFIDYLAPTASQYGNIEHYRCFECDSYWIDELRDTEVTAEDVLIAKLPPEIIEGADGSYALKSKVGLSVTSNASREDFITVLVNGEEVDSSYYTLGEDELSVELSPEFLDTLKRGKHKLIVRSESGDAFTSFRVLRFKMPVWGWVVIALILAGIIASVTVHVLKEKGVILPD